MTRDTRCTVGVLGGLGPQATLDFFARIISCTPAAREQDHLHLLIDNNPQVPDRNAAVAGIGPSPAAVLAQMAKRLETAGADFLVMPCNAAHAFAAAIREAVSIPLVSIIDVTRDEAMRRFPDVRSVGLLASSGCVDAGLYQQAFGEVGVEVLLPTSSEGEQLTQLVYEIKAGDTSDSVARGLRTLAAKLIARGAELVVAGCTEVPLVLREGEVPFPIVSSTDVLVARTIELARGLAAA